ncbi:EF hand family protein [Tritrichomonas foetus]|uniref:EF hand family protein n=1 Tax=Tritrichomonas foetus TaxID=1144522 RepID=A0A1J4KLH9_9EUKA|nr:EF hand family protein [Tritrichomonas foetus]|eukprot:OHT12153.1 EF hand family protein [Tritrichomonas foetus]
MGAEEAKPIFHAEQHFSEYELEELHAAFDEIDADQNSYLDEPEFKDFLKKSKLPVDSSTLILKIFGTGPNSSISFTDFCHYIHSISVQHNSPESFTSKIFKTLDKNNNGYVSADEILEYGKLIKAKFTLKDAQAIVDKHASNKKQGMTQLEIVRFILSIIF